ncbi:MAG: LLM class flavin-dependent oxidoreductase [Thermoleophilia bacterium]
MTRYGVTLQGVYDPPAFIELVRWIEELGYDDLWLTDSSLHAGDVYVYATLALMSTARLRVGTAVTNPLTRHPAITANATASLADVAGGRVACGIGVGDRPLGEIGLGMASIATLRETIEALRSLWRGDLLDGLEVGPWSFTGGKLRSAVEEIPVYVAASRPRALELTGEVADGLILLAGLFPEGLAFARDHLVRGRARSNRPVFNETLFLYGAVNDDEEQALESARSIAAWFPHTAPDYARLAGMDEELIAEVNAAYTGGEFQHAGAAARLIPDELVRKIAFCGTPKQAAEKLSWLESEGCGGLSVFPLGPDRRATIAHFARLVGLKRQTP